MKGSEGDLTNARAIGSTASGYPIRKSISGTLLGQPWDQNIIIQLILRKERSVRIIEACNVCFRALKSR